MKILCTTKNNRNYCRVVLLLIITLFTSVAMGQKYRYGKSYQPTTNRYFIGIESGMGTATSTFKSDIADLSNLKFNSTGWNLGLIAGDKAFKFRATYGKYSFQKSLSQTIGQNLLSVNVNVSPIQLFSKVKYFRMYAVTGVDYGTFSFAGISVPKFVDPNAVKPPKQVCCCETDGTSGPPADPGAPGLPEGDESNNLVDSKDLNLKKAQINAGLGAEFTMAKGGKYFRMFAEAHYGIPLKEIISDLSLNNTSLSSQLVVNIGVGFGITR